eukprot:c6341_g1_i1.p2 GENE.c6341_g1_i1~~c6341_g1_i1.p2  ORF type:complete len:186 (+),score=31.36 c6341_g1_i1:68-625(+)
MDPQLIQCPRPHLDCLCKVCGNRGLYVEPAPVLIGYTLMKVDEATGETVPLSDAEIAEFEKLFANRAEWNQDFREKHWWKTFDQILQRLQREKGAIIYFNAPVDYVRYNLLDYPTIITHPMDLGTIRTRMDTGYYVHPEDIIDDIRRVFHNSFTYSPPGDPPRDVATALSAMFEEQLRRRYHSGF